MNIYLKKDSIEKLFNKVSDNLIFSDEEAPANKFLLGDYTKVFTDFTEEKNPFIDGQNLIFEKRAEAKYGNNDESKPQREQYISECMRTASPTDGADSVGIFELDDYKNEKDYTFYIEESSENLIWKHEENKDIYQELTVWLKDNVFKEESYSSYKDKFNKFSDFITNAFKDIDNRKITDVIIYDPYILENFNINAKLWTTLNKLNSLNIIIFTSNITKHRAARKGIYDQFKKHNVTFITIPQSAHDRFILSNYFYIKSGKGFMLDLDENLGNDVTASKTGINTRKTFLEWSEKRNMLQNYLNNNEAIIGQGKCKSGILSFTPENLNKIIGEEWDDLLYTAIFELNKQTKAKITCMNNTIEILNVTDLTDIRISNERDKIKQLSQNSQTLLNPLSDELAKLSNPNMKISNEIKQAIFKKLATTLNQLITKHNDNFFAKTIQNNHSTISQLIQKLSEHLNNKDTGKKAKKRKTDQPASIEDLQKKWPPKHSKDNR